MTRLAATAGVLTISFSAIFMRLASAAPATAAFWRVAYALPVLFLVRSITGSADGRDRGARALAFGAGLLLAVDLVLWQRSIDLIGASLGVVLANLQVVFVGSAAWVLHRERPSRVAFAVVPAILAGIALVSGLGREDSYGVDPVAGTLFGLGAAATYSGFLLVFRQSNRRHLVPPAGPLLDASTGALLGSLLAAPFDAGFTLAIEWPQHGWLLALALLPHVVGWLLISMALPRLAALETSVMLLIQPVAAIVWARMIFDERLSTTQWLGVALVLGGILVLTVLGTVRRSTDRVTSGSAAAPGAS